MGNLGEIKLEQDDFEVEFELINPFAFEEGDFVQNNQILEEIKSIDARLDICERKIAELNTEIDKLTNQADGLDYAVAVISGTIAGMIDTFFVGESELDKEKIQKMLEKKYHTANDSAYKHRDEEGHWISSATYHRLDDLAHHPTPAGLVAAILVRYFRLVVFIDGSDGKPHLFFADTNNLNVLEKEKMELKKAWVGAVISGVCLWLADMAEKKYEKIYEEKMPEPLRKMVKAIGATPMIIEILRTADVWLGHMMSDVSTSQGIPGIFLSFFKEISVLPIFRNTNLPDVYREGNKNLSEWGGVVFYNTKKQAIPVIINEAIVRGFYFVRHLVSEYKKHTDWRKVDWSKVIPAGNRTIVRMLTISTGTMTVVDLADAAIRSAIKSGGINPAFFSNMILKVNFVGVGRFVISVGTDVGMGIKRERTKKEREELLNEWIQLTNSKIYYREADVMCSYVDMHKSESEMQRTEADMWKEVKSVHEAMGELDSKIKETCKTYVESHKRIAESCREISELVPGIEMNNPGLLEELFRRY